MSILQNKLMSKLSKIDKCFSMVMNASGISRRGVPDIMVIIKGKVFFAEIKEPGDRLSKIQSHTIEFLKSIGVPVFIIKNNDDIISFIEEIIK